MEVLAPQSPGLRSGGLESKFGRGPGHLGQEGDGLVLLVPMVQVGRVFSGYPAGALIRESSGDLVWLVFRPSTVVRLKMKDGRWKKEI